MLNSVRVTTNEHHKTQPLPHQACFVRVKCELRRTVRELCNGSMHMLPICLTQSPRKRPRDRASGISMEMPLARFPVQGGAYTRWYRTKRRPAGTFAWESNPILYDMALIRQCTGIWGPFLLHRQRTRTHNPPQLPLSTAMATAFWLRTQLAYAACNAVHAAIILPGV